MDYRIDESTATVSIGGELDHHSLREVSPRGQSRHRHLFAQNAHP